MKVRRGLSKVGYTAIIVVVVVLVAVAGIYVAFPSLLGVKSTTTSGAKPYNILLMLTGGLTATWDRANIAGLEQAAENLNSTSRPIHLAVVGNLPYDPTAEYDYINGYAQLGKYNLIIIADQDNPVDTVKIAQAYPNTEFVGMNIPTGNLTKNLSEITWNMWEGYYPAGILAGLMTKSNVVGFVTAFWFSKTAEIFNAFKQGVLSVNPNAKVLYALTADWSDPTKGASAASALISAGADVVIGVGDGMTDGVISQCASLKVYTFGYIYDESNLAPNYIITSVLWIPTAYYLTAVNASFSSNFGGQDWVYGARQHTVGLAPIASWVPSSAANQAEQAMQNLYTGQLTLVPNATVP